MRIVMTDPAGYTPPYDDSLCAALARRGHAVDLLTCPFRFGSLPEPDGFRRHELFFPLTGHLFRRAPRSPLRLAVKTLEYGPSAVRLLHRIDRTDPAVVHVQWTVLPRLDARWLGTVVSRRPTVLTAHDVLPRRRRDLAAWRSILRRVDRVLVHSPHAVEMLAELGVERARVTPMRHPAFGPDAGTTPQPPQGTTLLFFGLLRSYKGLDTLIEALESIGRRVPQARLVVAGDPLDPVEPLRTLAHRLGMTQRIEWRLGFVPEQDVTALMGAATVVVLPYRRGEASGVLATALGHHRPVVVSDVGSLGQLVREFDAGVAVPPGDAAELASACVALLTDPAALDRAYRGAQAAAAALTWDEAARAHEQVYEEVRSERAGAPCS